MALGVFVCQIADHLSGRNAMPSQENDLQQRASAYRAYAKRAMERASNSSTAEMRDSFAGLAQAWLQLAEMVERRGGQLD